MRTLFATSTPPVSIAWFQRKPHSRSFGVLDLDARYPVTRATELYVSVQNVFDREYLANKSGALEYFGLPRTVVAGVSVRAY